jgi:hypothetical protein
MFRRFLDASDYWFGYSDDSSAGSYDPRGSAASSSPTTQQTLPTWRVPATERFLLLWGLDRAWLRGQAPLPPHHRGAPTSTHNWPKHASSRPSWRKSTERCGCSAPLSREKPPRAANSRVSWADKPAIASMPTSTSTIQIRPRERAKSSSPSRHCCGPCPPLRRPRRGTCTARCRRSSSKRPSNRPKARRPASAKRGAREMMGVRKALSPRYTRAARLSAPPTRGARQPRNGSSTRADKPETATPATSSTPNEQAKRRRGRQQATTLDGVDITTAMWTAHRRRSPREPACLARRSAWRPSPSASASPRRSSSTTGRRTPVCGSTTTTWCVSWVEPPATRLSSATPPPPAPRRLGTDVARAPAGQPDPQLG